MARQEDFVNGYGEALETRIQRLKIEIQGEIDGANEGLKKGVSFLETEINSLR